jgi:membrane-bound lytic murein transglycosylase D
MLDQLLKGSHGSRLTRVEGACRGMRGKSTYIVLAALLALPLFGCASSMDQSPASLNQISVTGEATTTPKGAARLLSSAEAGSLPGSDTLTRGPGALPFVRNNPKPVAPFPLVLNQTVQTYVDDYLAQPQGLEESFKRSEPYMPEMFSLLESGGLPRDLIYLAFAESAFSNTGAGPWQLSKTTGRRYGLRINRWVDERRDPIKSTRAAAEYLATLHDETGSDWRMTLVAWNNGDTGVGRYIELQDAPYEQLMNQLPQRTRSLMNRFMAVAFIAHKARQYGIETASYMQTPHYNLIPVSGGMPLTRVAQKTHTSVDVLRSLNPALLRDRVPPGLESYTIRVPDNNPAI